MRLFFAGMFVVFATSVKAIDVKVIDGDSLFVDNREVRLEGIDAPEFNQQCEDKLGKKYDCGKESYDFLKSMVEDDIRCQYIAKDRYKRSVAICVSQGVNINEQMVKQGWAVAYDRYNKDYIDEEKEAKKLKKGIWQGKFMRPELYRVMQSD